MVSYGLSINDDGLSYLLTRDGHVVEASSSFMEMTGYAKEDIVGKDANIVWELLRVDMSECCTYNECNCEHFIFTRSLEPRNVFISAPRVSTQDEKIYFFEEIPHSRIEDKLPHVHQMYMDNIKGIAIFSAPEGIFLRANDTFIQYLEEPYNTAECSIGHKVSEIITGWEESKIKMVWEDTIKLGKSYYHQEYKHDQLKIGITYWDISLIPIKEGSSVKYIISTLSDVTRIVADRNLLSTQAQTINRQKNELQAVIESLDNGLIMVDKQGNYKSLNEVTKKYFPRNELISRGDFYKYARIYNDDGSEMKIEESPINNVLKGSKIKKSGYIETEDGNKNYFEAYGVPIFDENGEFYSGVISIHDITKHILQAKLIEEQKEKLDSVIESISDGIIISDKDYNIIQFNEAAREYFYDPDSINNIRDLHTNTTYYDKEGNEATFETLPAFQVFQGRRIIGEEYSAVRPDRTIHINVSGNPILDKDGNILMAVLCIRNVDERVQYENMLRAQRDTLYKILDTLDFPMCRISYPDLSIVEINRKAYKFAHDIGFNSGGRLEMIRPGVNLRDAFPTADLTKSFRILEEIERKKTAAYINDYEIVNERKKYYVNVVFNPLLDSYGNVEEILMIVVDVTREIVQRKELEQVLKMQEEFFSFISHEFKTPLTVISSAVQVLKLLYKDEISVKAMKYIDKINQSTLQQIRLVNNLLDITRASAGYLKVHRKNRDIVSITRAISDSVGLYAMKRNIDVKFSSSFPERTINIDDEKYERILLNLLSNAIKFTPEGKSIYVNVKTFDDKVIIEVKDEGIGIPKNRRPAIFERFIQVDNGLTRQSEGTGLGLCLSKMLVNAMNGEIMVESEEGIGSSFKIILPDLVDEEGSNGNSPKPMDNELVEMLNVEFSNIYFD